MRLGAVAVLVRVPARLGDPIGVLARSAAMVIVDAVGVAVVVVVRDRFLLMPVATTIVMRVAMFVVVRSICAGWVMLAFAVVVVTVAMSDDVMVEMGMRDAMAVGM